MVSREQLERLKAEFDAALSCGAKNGDLTTAQNLKQKIQISLSEIKTKLGQPYELTVDYSRPIRDLLIDGHFESITTELFTSNFTDIFYGETGQHPIKFFLFQPTRLTTRQDDQSLFSDFILQMQQHNLFPARLKELLYFAITHPEVQLQQWPIVALGSHWTPTLSDLGPFYPFLGAIHRYDRVISTAPLSHYHPSWHFAAVHRL